MACNDALANVFEWAAKETLFGDQYPVYLTLTVHQSSNSNNKAKDAVFYANGRLGLPFSPLQVPPSPPKPLSGRLKAATNTSTEPPFFTSGPWEYQVSVSPTGQTSILFLINGKPFLNRPAVEFQGQCSSKGLLTGTVGQTVYTLSFTRGKMIPAQPQQSIDVRITYRPLLAFQAYLRFGTDALASGDGRIFTIYQIYGIQNSTNVPYTFELARVRVDSGLDPDDFYDPNTAIVSIIRGEAPGYLAEPNFSFTIPPNTALGSNSTPNITIVVNTDDVTNETPNFRRLAYLGAPDLPNEGMFADIDKVPVRDAIVVGNLPQKI